MNNTIVEVVSMDGDNELVASKHLHVPSSNSQRNTTHANKANRANPQTLTQTQSLKTNPTMAPANPLKLLDPVPSDLAGNLIADNAVVSVGFVVVGI